jgi:hypothetical protein
VSPGAEPIYNENSRNVPGLEARREPRLNYRALRDRKETGAIVVTITTYGAGGDMGGDSKLLGSMTSSAGRDIFLYPTKLMREHERTMQEVF